MVLAFCNRKKWVPSDKIPRHYSVTSFVTANDPVHLTLGSGSILWVRVCARRLSSMFMAVNQNSFLPANRNDCYFVPGHNLFKALVF